MSTIDLDLESSSSSTSSCFHQSQLKELLCLKCYKEELSVKKNLNGCEENHGNKMERQICTNCCYLDLKKQGKKTTTERPSEVTEFQMLLHPNLYDSSDEEEEEEEEKAIKSLVYEKATKLGQRTRFITSDILTSSLSVSKNSVIVQIVNAIATTPHGLSYDIGETFEYARVYNERTPMGKLNRCIVSERPRPSCLLISKPPNKKNLPTIISIVGQYYMGRPKEENLQSQYFLNHPKKLDWHFVLGLLSDTKHQRLMWFKTALQNLSFFLIENNWIEHVCFPYRIGCGLAGGDWTAYFKEIELFAKHLHPSKNVVIFKNPEPERKYIQCKRLKN